MRVYINAEARDLNDSISLAALADTLGLDTRKLAMELNLNIIPRSQYGDTLLSEGDRIEIVQFIGGG